MEFIKKRRVSTFTSLIVLMIALMVLTGWIFDIRQLRAIIPGLPQMVPPTALMIGLLSLSLFLISTSVNEPYKPRSKVALGLCTFTLLFSLYSVCNHIFGFDTGIESFFFRSKILMNEDILYAGKMSVQTSLATLFVSSSLLLFRQPGRQRGYYLFEGLLIATAALCLSGIIGYLHDMSMSGPSKYIGLSLPSIISFFLLAIGTVFLKIDRGIVKSVGSRDSAGLFLRYYLTFSILFPVISSTLINWGEMNGYYPDLFSKTLFVIVIISSLVILGLFMASVIRKLEGQRIAIEKAEAKAALDVTEESLMRTKEHLEMALDASAMGSWETDLENRVIELSATAKALLGVESASGSGIREEAVYKNIHPDDLEHVRQQRVNSVDMGKDLNIDFRCVAPDGTVRWLRSKGRTKYDRLGNPVRLTGTVIDITSEKKHQQQLEEALKEAESASSLKSSFLANMSHEIRTPLGAILGFADVLNDPTLSVEDRARYLQIIQRNGETLSHLLNDILDLSKVESGHLDVEKIRFPLRNALNEVTSLLEVRAKERGLSLSVDFDPKAKLTIVSDPMRLKQILMNLVGNALKFTDSGSVSIFVRSEDKKVKFEITDTGVGIEPEKQKKLFKPFSQADNSITRIFGGTGLGLVLSRRLAELLGGSIELTKSVVGEGSTFTLTVEDYAQTESTMSKPLVGTAEVQVEKALTGYRILLTEDSPDIQKLLMLILKKEGAEVDLAQNGDDCLQKYQQHDYDIILMDIQMPIMDGYTAARQLRERGYKKPVLALTAHAMSDEHQRCLQAGCDGYLSKPVNRKKLVDLILEVAQR